MSTVEERATFGALYHHLRAAHEVPAVDLSRLSTLADLVALHRDRFDRCTYRPPSPQTRRRRRGRGGAR